MSNKNITKYIEDDLRLVATALHCSYLNESLSSDPIHVICHNLVGSEYGVKLQDVVLRFMQEERIENAISISKNISYLQDRYKLAASTNASLKKMIRECMYRWPLLFVLIPRLQKIWTTIGFQLQNQTKSGIKNNYATQMTIKDRRANRVLERLNVYLDCLRKKDDGVYYLDEYFATVEQQQDWNNYIMQFEEFFYKKAFRKIYMQKFFQTSDHYQILYVDTITELMDSFEECKYEDACRCFNDIGDISAWDKIRLAQYIYSNEKSSYANPYSYLCIYLQLRKNVEIKDRNDQLKIVLNYLLLRAPSFKKVIQMFDDEDILKLITDKSLDRYYHIYHKDRRLAAANELGILEEGQAINEILNCSGVLESKTKDEGQKQHSLQTEASQGELDEDRRKIEAVRLGKSPTNIKVETHSDAFCESMASHCTPNDAGMIKYFFWGKGNSYPGPHNNMTWNGSQQLFAAYVHYAYINEDLSVGSDESIQKVFSYVRKKHKRNVPAIYSPMSIKGLSKSQYGKFYNEIEKNIM